MDKFETLKPYKNDRKLRIAIAAQRNIKRAIDNLYPDVVAEYPRSIEVDGNVYEWNQLLCAAYFGSPDFRGNVVY